MIRKNSLLVLAALFFFHTLSAQQLPSTLLWRISGKDLKNPSYLFGTMHLTDERIFNLGDSVYNAIENCDGFATEIDPAAFTSMIIKAAKKTVSERVYLKDFLSTENYDKYGKLLAKKFNKAANEITTDDIKEKKDQWLQESISNGKMKTFLDIYLFDIARRKGKYTGGIEDPEDQENLPDLIEESDIETIALYDNYEDAINDLNDGNDLFIQAYVDKDLNLIQRISQSSDSAYKDAVLVKRNKKMAMRMDSMCQVRSMVFAIGAAHLPGEYGLISLLQEKGYTVSPVFSSKKIKPADYTVADQQVKWYPVQGENNVYTAFMPGEAESMDWYGLMKMKVYFDVFSSTIYLTSSLLSPYSQTAADSLIDRIASEFFGTSFDKSSEPVYINNIPGREFRSTQGDYAHGYLAFHEGKFYMALAKSMKKDSAASDDINRFLKSFSINKPEIPEGKNFVFTNKTKAYTIELPAQPKSGNEMTAAMEDSTLERELYYCINPETGAYFFFGSNETAAGYFIQNDSTTLDQMRTSQEGKFERYTYDTTFVSNGYRTMELEGIMAGTIMKSKIRYQFRGNRWYALVAMYDSSKYDNSIDKFFSSFKTLDYDSIDWKHYASDDSLFQTWAPINFKLTRQAKEDGDQTIYTSYDTTRGDTYSFSLEQLSKYFWQNSDSVFWAGLIGQYENNNRILQKKEVSNGDSRGYELWAQEPGSANIKRIRILVNADRIGTLITVQAASEINNENNNKFFETFRFAKTPSNAGLFVSKAQLLLKDIGSSDSAVASEANKYLNIVTFTTADIAGLQEALVRKYPDNINSPDEEIKQILAKNIIDLKDTSSLTFAKNIYMDVDDTTRKILLNIMVSFPTKENFTDITKILLTHPPRITPDYNFSIVFTDSATLAATAIPELLPLLNDTVMASTIIRMSKILLDKEVIRKGLLIPYIADLLKISERNYDGLLSNPDEYSYYDYDLLSLLAALNTSKTVAMLQKWSVSKQLYLQQHAVYLLLKNNHSINPIALQALAENKETRTELYDTLKALKKLKLFPKKFLTQRSFAESIAYVTASDDYEPSSLTFVTDKVYDFDGKESRFYFFKASFADNEEMSPILVCAGPFPMDRKDLTTKNAFSELYDQEDFDPSNLSGQTDALMEQMKASLEWWKKYND